MKRGRLITIGSFDGVHLGHQALVKRTVLEAKKRHLKSLALTFAAPPRMVLDPNAPHRILSDAAEKQYLLKSHGIDDVMFFNFDKKASEMKPFAFFRSILFERLKAKGIVVGADFRFGAGRAAGAVELVRWGEEFEIPIWIISPVKHSHKIVSSSLIRQLMETNHFKQAIGFLGHPYLIEGHVVRGRQVGREIGFPTLNIRTSPGKVLPRGVFVVRGEVIRPKPILFEGVCNIGTRPTFLKKSELAVEVHAFGDLPEMMVNKKVRFDLLHWLRPEKKFSGIGALKKAITADVFNAKRFLSRETNLN